MAQKSAGKTRRPRVGDRVRFLWGTSPVTGVVIEDRGPLGLRGRHLYSIRARMDEYEDNDLQLELPADDFEIVTD